jgi:hypothetical protein
LLSLVPAQYAICYEAEQLDTQRDSVVLSAEKATNEGDVDANNINDETDFVKKAFFGCLKKLYAKDIVLESEAGYVQCKPIFDCINSDERIELLKEKSGLEEEVLAETRLLIHGLEERIKTQKLASREETKVSKDSTDDKTASKSKK